MAVAVQTKSRAGLRPVFGGTATVHCVHDRQKRQVITEAQVAALAVEHGIVYDPAQHKIHSCACCGNLFVDPSDEPRFCIVCQGIPAHLLGGPLPEPTGVVDG
jgi:hypothetical protein